MNTQKDKKEKKKRTFLIYSISALCLVAVGMSVYFSVAKQIAPKPEALQQKNPVEVESTPQTDFVLPEKPKAPSTAPAQQKKPSEAKEKPSEPTKDVEDVLANKGSIKREAAFSLPMDSATVKEYSNGEMVPSKTMGDWRTHNGVDFGGAVGDPVKAINNGIVKAVYDDVLWGTVVEIDHGKGMLARYCGFGKGSTVSVGDKVKINDKVGNLGEIPLEKADGTHLHLEIYQDGKLVDPMKAMGK